MFLAIRKLYTALFVSSLFFVLAFNLANSVVCAAPEVAQRALAPGKAACDFTLPDSNGKNWKLSSLRGKFVVLEWFNDGCPFVKKHYDSGNMQNLQKTYTKKGVIWLTIVSSAPGKQGHHSGKELNAIMQERKAAPSAVLLDPDGKVGRLYGAKTTPDMFVINPKGVLVYAGAIDDKPDTDINSIAQAKNYVKEALDEGLAKKPIAISSTKSYGCSVKY
jgi:peroxiredoxin